MLLVGAGDDAREAPGLLSGRGVVVLAEAGDRDRLSAATRSALATLSGSGRADVIVTFGPSLARCGRWVRRGGTIAAGTPTSQGPPLDYLVMREVRIAGVRRPHMRLEGLAS